MTSSPRHKPSTNFISVPQVMRFYSSGQPFPDAGHVWICLHGYGQLAQYFMQKFRPIEGRVHLVFPEAMHRFYLKGNGGRVGASWMTKEERLTDISNQADYLDALYRKVIGSEKRKVSVIGFSQGAATAARWVFGTRNPIDNLVLWSSAFPPDLSDVISAEENTSVSVYQLIGIEDPYLTGTADEINSGIELPIGIQSELITFDGGHDIRSPELELIADRIQS